MPWRKTKNGKFLGINKRPLAWGPHLQFYISFFFVFVILLPIVYLIHGQLPYVDFITETMKYGITIATEFIIIFVFQAVANIFFENKKPYFKYQLMKQKLSYGLVIQGSKRKILKDTLIFLFCFLVPLDFFTYLVPGILNYMAITPVGKIYDGLIPIQFFTCGICYNLLTGIKEEFVFRGYFVSRLEEKGTDHSAWLISGTVFGLLHVNVFSSPLVIHGPVLWFVEATFVGLLFGGYFLQERTILPLIFAHGLGNFISATVIWVFYNSNNLMAKSIYPFLLVFYLPMLIAGAIFALLFRRRIKFLLMTIANLIKKLRFKTVGMDFLIIAVSIIILWLAGLFLYL
ncbi:MAG: CPBP family intramembrane glutamic endopeptidase [Promethearchaeota archaeon]